MNQAIHRLLSDFFQWKKANGGITPSGEPVWLDMARRSALALLGIVIGATATAIHANFSDWWTATVTQPAATGAKVTATARGRKVASRGATSSTPSPPSAERSRSARRSWKARNARPQPQAQ